MQSQTIPSSDALAQARQALSQGLEQAIAACQTLTAADQAIQTDLATLGQRLQAIQEASAPFTEALPFPSPSEAALATPPPETLAIAASATPQLPKVITDCQRLFEASTDANVWLENGVLIDCNQATVRLMGYIHKAELLGKSPVTLSPEVQPDGMSSWQKAQEILPLVVQQGSHRFEWMHQRTNGDLFWVEILLTAINSNGRQLVHGIWRDITAYKAAEAELHEQTQLLRSTYEGVDHSIVIIDVVSEQDFHYVGWNPATEKNTGLPSAAIAGKNSEELLGEEQGKRVRQRYQQCVTAGTAITYEEFLPFKGQDHWWLTTLNPLKDEDGNVSRIVLTTFEISERKATEAALQQQEYQYRSIFESINDGIFIQDINTGEIITVNPSICKMHGYTHDEFIQLNSSDYVHPESLPIFAQFVKTIQARQRFTAEAVDLHKDGTSIDIEVTSIPFDCGDRPCALSVVRDISDRKRLEVEQQEAEAELQNANSFLISVLEAVPGFFFAKDRDSKFITVNSNLARFFQQTPSEVIGKTDFDFFPSEIAQAMIANDCEVMAQGDIERFEEAVTISPSETATYLSTKAPLLNAMGEVVGIIGLAQDISDRKAMEVSLRQSEQRFRDVTEAAGEYIWEISADGIYTFVTEQAKAVKGYWPDELLGHTPFEFMPPEDIPHVEAIVTAAAENKSTFQLEHRDILPSGEVIWESVSGIPILDDSGEIIGFRGTGLSITERKLAEAAVAESEAKFRRLVEDASDCIYTVNADYQFTYLSPQFTEMWGYPVSECLNQPFAPLVHPDDLASVIEPVNALFTTGERQTISEFRTRRQDGTYFWITCTNTPIKNDQGQVIGFQGVARDISDHKLAEAAIAASEAKFRHLVEDANDMIYIVDAENRFTYISPQFTQMWGYPIEAYINQPFAPLIHPDDLPSVIAAVEALFATGERQKSIEFRTRHQDGTFFWIVCGITPIENDQDQIVSFQGIARDVTDRKLAEAAIAESEAKFRRLIENADDLIYVIDADYCFTYLSPQFTEMWGYTVEEFMHQSFAPLIHPDDMPIAIDSIQTLFATGDRQTDIELRTFHQDGTLFWITCSNIPVKNDQGQVIGWQGTARDISERKAFEETQSRLTAILDATSDFVGMSNVQGEQLYMNPAGRQMLDIPEDLEIQGRPLDIHLPDWARSIVLEEGVPTAIREGIWQGEAGLRAHSGREFPVSQVIIAHKGADGEVEYLSTIVRDITAQKQSEIAFQQKAKELEQTLEELQQTQLQMIQSEKLSSLGQLVAGVAHEINNPVSFIHGNIKPMTEYTQDLIDLIDLYQTTYPSPAIHIEEKIEDIDLEFLKEDSPKILTSMQVGTERIRQIVGSLKNFSRLDEADCKEVDIHEGLDSTLLILEHRIKATPERPAIHIEKDYGDLPLVNCYPGQLNQVFMNILANALDALEQRARDRSLEDIKRHPSMIKIQTQRMGLDRVLICIEDNGPGIPEEFQKRIFDPFFTTKPIGKGTGIGMSISHQIITEKHGGKLQCTSAPEQGAKFLIEIPC